ncbi:MAG: hypothetical protein IRY83_03960 [Chloroflexi bacterium]|nr:hypothetical protein [Chloroflexota bacterium]
MAHKRQRDAQCVVEQQAEAIHHLLLLRNHRTIQANPQLRMLVNHAWQSLKTANALACALWFPSDTHADVSEFLPPAA